MKIACSEFIMLFSGDSSAEEDLEDGFYTCHLDSEGEPDLDIPLKSEDFICTFEEALKGFLQNKTLPPKKEKGTN